jgi:hypothetical protein
MTLSSTLNAVVVVFEADRVGRTVGLIEHDARLISGGRGRVHLGALLAVGD